MKNRKSRKLLAAVISICLILAVGAGATFAFYKADAGSKTNTFTFVGPTGMDAELTETFDPNDALNLTPGASVDKTPIVTNTSSSDVNEWVAVKVTVTDNAGTLYTGSDLTTVLSAISLDWTADGAGAKWIRCKSTTAADNTQYFYYNTLLAKASATDALFTKLTVSSAASDAAMTLLAANGLKITITGCAVQGEAFQDAAAVEADINGTSSQFTFA